MHPKKLNELCQFMAFLFTKSIHEETLTVDFTGVLDAIAASENKDECWISEHIVNVDTPKTIVLTTWYFDYLNSFERETVVSFFFKLLRANYPLAISTARGIESIHDINTLRRQLSSVVPLSATTRLERSDVAIIDAGRLRLLLNKLTSSQTFDDTNALLPDELSEMDLQLLEKNIRSQDTLALNLVSGTAKRIVKFPLLCDRVHALRGMLNNLNDNDLLSQIEPFKKLDQFCFHQLRVSMSTFVRLLNTPGLKKLELEFGSIEPSPDFMADWEAMHNNGLTHLILKRFYVDEFCQLDLIKKNPGLQRLVLENIYWYRVPHFDIPPGHFSQLKELNLKQNPLNPQQHQALILAAPNIERFCPAIEPLADKQKRLERQARDASSRVSKKQRGAQAEPGLVFSSPLLGEEHLEKTVSRRSSSTSPPQSPLPRGQRKRLTREDSDPASYELGDDAPSAADQNDRWISHPYKQLTTIDMSYWMLDAQDLGDALSNPLSQLDLSFSTNTNDALLAHAEQRLFTLRNCSVNYSRINTTGLQTLLKMFPNMEALSFRGCKFENSGPNPFFFSGTLDGLCFLNASCSHLTSEQLSIILHAAPNLTSLNLSSCMHLALDQLRLKPRQLPYLEDLNLSLLPIKPQFFKAIWEAAPNLVSINLEQCQVLDLPSHLKEGSLMYVNARGSNLDEAGINTILKANPLLRTLNISACKLPGDRLLNPDLIMLNQLEEFLADEVQISGKQLTNLFRTAPALVSISLVDHIWIAGADEERYPRLHNLKNLMITNIKPEGEQYIWNLISRTPKLEKLRLESDQLCNVAPASPLKRGSLRHLRSIQISYFGTIAELTALILAAPNLTAIKLSRIWFDFSDLHLLPGDLAQLNDLNLSDSAIDIDSLHRIIQIAPCLKEVTIDRCPCLEPEALEQLKADFPGINWSIVTVSNPSTSSLPSTPSQPPSRPATTTSSAASTTVDMPLDGRFKHNPATQHKSQKIFTGNPMANEIPAEAYHLYIYRWGAQRFIPYQPREQNLVEVKPEFLPFLKIPQVLAQHNLTHYRAQVEFPWLHANIWYMLPATSSHDRLKYMASSLTKRDLNLQYDTETGYTFFQVKTEQSRPVLFLYLVKSGLNKEIRQTDRLDLNTLISQLRFRADGHLEPNEAFQKLIALSTSQRIAALFNFCNFEKSSGEDIEGSTPQLLNYLITHRAGACRHRAQLFLALSHNIDLSAFVIGNVNHAFVIAHGEDGLIRCLELGGSAATIVELPVDDGILDNYYDPQMDLDDDPDPLIESIPAPDPSNRYLTWNNRPLQSNEATTLINELIDRSHRMSRQLLISEDIESIEALHQRFIPNHHSLFSRQLDDISLTSTRIANGQYLKVDSLIAQLFNDAENNPDAIFTWFINWSDAEARHKGLASLVTSSPSLQGRNVPTNLHVVVLIDRGVLTTMNARFKHNLPYRSILPRLSPEPHSVSSKIISERDVLIVNPSEWKKILLGHVNMQAQRPKIIPGALFGQRRTISIQNAPLDNSEFRMFLTDLKKFRQVYFNGEWQPLATGFRIDLHKPIINFPLMPAIHYSARSFLAINQSNYKLFFERTQIDENGIQSRPGLLEEKQKQQIHLSVTQQLGDLQYYMLQQEARRWSSRIIFEPTPQVRLPEGLATYSLPQNMMRSQDNVTVYLSDDLDFVASRLNLNNMIPISRDTRFESLFIVARRLENGHFTAHDTDLLQAIKQGKDIVLKGKFSEILVHKLQSLFTHNPTLQINGEEIAIRSKLIILSNDDELFANLTCTRMNYDPEESFSQLHEAARLRLQACYQRLAISPCFSHFQDCPTNEDAQISWVARLEKRLHLAAGVPLAAAPGSSCESPKATTPAELIRYLRHHPFVFLIGASGAGKSYLLKKEVPAFDPNITVYHGLAELQKWLNHKDGIAYLFIDEANISTQDYLIFEALARGESVIWVNGIRYDIPPTHKIVFAGNPYAYGGRLQADLFRRFPYYMEFRAQPLQQILDPLLTLFHDPNQAMALIQHYYDLVLESGITFTPRNAFMICQRVLEMKHNYTLPRYPEYLLLQQALLTELKGLRVEPSKIKPLRRLIKEDPLWQLEGKGLQNALRQRLPAINDPHFHMTTTRKKVALALLGFLAIREQRIRAPARQSQGINGFMLEGHGLGKGLLIQTMLQALRIPYTTIALDNPIEAHRLLLHAHENNELVFIPKLSTDVDERLLNDLLSTFQNPGFGVIAVHDGGSLSKALSNRFTCMNLEDSIDDLQAIVKKRLNPQDALLNDHMNQYRHALDYGRQADLSPLPGAALLFEELMKDQGVNDDPEEPPSSFGLD